MPEDVLRPDVHMIARNFTEAAEAMGGARVANMVMLGALMEATGILPLQHVIAALRRLVKNLHLFAIDRRALERGAEMVEESRSLTMKAEAIRTRLFTSIISMCRCGMRKVSILTHALHYGTGVFDGIRGYWDEAQQELFLVRPMDHFRRWKRNCGILRIDVPMTAEMLCDITLHLIPRNQFRSNVYVRPLAYKCAERIGISPDDQDSLLDDRDAVRRLSAERQGPACGREFVAAHRRQRHPRTRQDLRVLREQRAGERRRAAQRL